MKNQIKQLKQECKELASKIRDLKSKRKDKSITTTGYVPGLDGARSDFRIKHIAYCLLRGRTLEQIEGSVKFPNNYNNKWIRKKATDLVKSIQDEILKSQLPEEPKEKTPQEKAEEAYQLSLKIREVNKTLREKGIGIGLFERAYNKFYGGKDE